MMARVLGDLPPGIGLLAAIALSWALVVGVGVLIAKVL